MKNEELFHRVKGERNVTLSVKRRKANWIGQILRRNYHLKLLIERNLQGRMESNGKTRKKT
jgi:hypothetical protein